LTGARAPAGAGQESETPFARDLPLEIPSISESVGEGEITLAMAAASGTLETDVVETLRIKASEDGFCIFCVETIRIGPNVRVPTELFTAKLLSELGGYESAGGQLQITYKIDTVTAIGAGGQPIAATRLGGPDSLILDSGFRRIPAAAEAVPCILAGRQGAALRKVGRGFQLIEGAARLVRRR